MSTNTLFPTEERPSYPSPTTQLLKLYLLLIFGINLEDVGGWIRLMVVFAVFAIIAILAGDVVFHIFRAIIRTW